ncbi:hypothetical protein C8R46DRAFT_395090 [Mycena filopes]|nr:hypothetical protein C8R46DRAFT_395090 [Mycena filopes]
MSVVPPVPAAPSKTLVLKTDWLGAAITVAETVESAAELIPFPYVKGVAAVIVRLLRAIEKVKKNREDLKELCVSSTKIASFLQDQIVQYGNTAAIKFNSICEELKSYLEEVVLAIQTLQDKSKGFRGQFKEVLKSSSITDRIAEYQKQIEEYRSRLMFEAVVETKFKVDDIHAVIMGPNFSVVQAPQNINTCPPPSRIFHGRQIILDKMAQFFTGGSGKQLIYVLHGLGGAGKTQTALKFIQDSSAHFTNIFLVDASTPETIDSGLKHIAVSKALGNSAADALNWFQSKQEDWLLFFDNADDPNLGLNSFIPKCNHGNIVITSRNLGVRVYGSHSLVSDMEEADAISLLLRSADKETSEDNLKIAAGIVKELCYLPLAIAQAGAFISTSEDLSGFLALYHKNRTHLLSQQPSQSHTDYEWTVYTTWQISFDKLSKPAATLLQLCSFLHYNGISEDMFSNASKYSFPPWRPSKEELEEPLKFLSQFVGPTDEWDSLRFVAVTNEIKAYSLISFDTKSRMFSIHPLVHSWTRSTLADEGSHLTCISSIVGMTITELPGRNLDLDQLKLVPHLGSLQVLDLTRGNNFQMEFWKIYHSGVKLREAQVIAEGVLHKRRLHFGEEHQATLEVMIKLGLTYTGLGQYKRAEELKTKVLEKQTKLLGEDHSDTVLAMGNLASTYRDLGEPKKAEKLETVVLEKRVKLFGEDHEYTLWAMANLASTYSELGAYKKAEELETVVLEKRTKLLGEDDPDTLWTMGNLASTYCDRGEYKRAQKLSIIVLEKRTKLFSEDHPHTVRAMANLASTYRYLGEYKEAEKLETVVLEKRIMLFGEDHPDTVLAMGNLASTYNNLGEYKRAMELEIKVLEKETKLLGEDHPDTVLAMGNLASTYRKLEEYRTAEELETVVLKKRTKLLGKDHPHTLWAMGNLASTYRNLGEYKEAEELETVVLEKRTKLLGENHPHTIWAMGNLALTYHNHGEYKKAEELQVTVLEKRRNVLGDKHPDTVRAMQNLASTYIKLSKTKELDQLEQLIQNNELH